jgi:hypothetical protein
MISRMIKNVLLVIGLHLLCTVVYGQLTGTKHIPGDYATITLAVTDVNTLGVGTGGVIFNIAANYAETITATISLTATGTIDNQIIFQKDPATSGANPLITAYTDGVGTPATAIQDGIWNMVGSDYVTINGIDVTDNPANTSNPATMEYGYALYKANVSNGCQFVTIKNCVITLNTINNAAGTAPMVDGSTGIAIMTASPSAATVALRTSTTPGTNSNNKIYHNTIRNCNTGIAIIGYVATPYTIFDANNDVGGTDTSTGNTIINFGGAAEALNQAAGIRTSAQYDLNISYNTLNNNNGSGTNHPNILRGINNYAAAYASATIRYNKVTISGGGNIQTITAIENSAGASGTANTINISNNIITNCTYNSATTGVFYGIYNNAASAATVLLNSNTLTGNSTSAVSGAYYAIINSGLSSTAISIDSNNIGSNILPAITLNAANSSSVFCIYNLGGTASATLSISNNNIQGIIYTIGGTGGNTLIQNSAATLSQAINNNIFRNLDINTSGSLTFISNKVIVSSTGIQNVNNNSINGSFTKATGGIVTLYTNTSASIGGSTINNNGNNFSNINLPGATTMAGWVNTDAGASIKNIQNNTFTNWTAGTGAVTAMNISNTGPTNSVTGNVINNISAGGAITAITTGAGNDRIYSNTINSLSTTGTNITGIAVSSGTNKFIYNNKIYDLQANNALGLIYGINISGTTAGVITATVYNNLIGDLRAPITSSTNAIIGINLISTRVSSNINVYYNTIYLNASSTGVNFGTTGVFHTASSTSTTATLNLRNNIIINYSIPSGSGLVVAYRRSSTALGNYAATSNNNLFYAGSPATNRLVFYDGTSGDQILSAYKMRVSPADALSVMEDLITIPKFLSVTGSSASFLHLDPSKATLAESGAVNITNLTTDYDGQTRQGNAGYSGTGTAPDIGADEMNSSRATALSGTYNVGVGQTFTSLTNAGGLFAGITNLGLKGNLVVNITSDLNEDGSNLLNAWVEQGTGNYSLTIQSNAAVLRTISGNVLAGLIRLNGVRRVTIDGSYGGTGNYFTFRNTNTAGSTGAAFTFLNGASGNIIRYCNIEAYTNATTGVILFSTSTVTGGNSNNSVSYCNINATTGGNTGSVCLYSGGTATAGFANTANSISNNNIFNYRDRAIDIPATGTTGWTIAGNSIYNGDISGNINYAPATLIHMIRISGGSGYNILNNYIGGNASNAGGNAAAYYSTAGLLSYWGILLTTTSAIPLSNIKGNTIANISVAAVPTSTTSTGSNVFMGIETNGSGINIGGSGVGEGNVIGSNTLNGSILITTTTTLSTIKTNVRGINCMSTGGLVNGNQVGGIDINNLGTAAGPSTLLCINVANAVAPAQVNNNIIGSTGTGAALNSIRVLSSADALVTLVTGITIAATVTSTLQVNGNLIQNVSYLKNPASGTLKGIENLAILPAVVTISNNTVNGNIINASTGGFYGITSSGVTYNLTISNNIISNNLSAAGTTGFFYGIYTSGTGNGVISILNNTISGNSTGLLTTGAFRGVYNMSNAAILSINANTFYGNTTTSASGAYYSIVNGGPTITSININQNNIGTSGVPAITFKNANSGTHFAIQNSAGGTGAALSISNNNFYAISYLVAGTGNHTFILNLATTLSQAINGNTFTNLNVNTTKDILFIVNNVIVPATGSQNINNNSIIGTFTKTGAGTVTLFSSTASSANGSIINNNNNNFSNITVTGAAVIAGWVNTDAGTSTKTIQNNTFNNWLAATGNVTVMYVNIAGTDNAITGNTISNIAGGGAVTGITATATSTGNDNIFLNNINTLSSNGVAAVTGIAVALGTTTNIYKNKIYNLSNSNASGTVNGILISGGTTSNIYNNLVGDLRLPSANSTTDLVRGINITSTTAGSGINVYYNTISLNATSSGINFSTTGIFHTASATATTAALNLRNNIISNTSLPKGSGLTVAYRRSASNLNNYVSTSNNNLFYAGTPLAGKQLIFYDGTNSNPLLTDYKTLVAGRDASSVTEDITTKFLSTTGSSSVFLHIDNTKPTLIESNAANIAGYTDDFDGQVRAGNPGYSGVGSTPDIGADEVFGIEEIPPTITYTLLANTTSKTNRSITGITITDSSGVNINAGTKPRIYYKRFSDANAWLDNTSNTNGWKFAAAANASSPFAFTIDYSLLYGGAAVTAGTIQYFIMAQDNATIANVGINSGAFTTKPTSVALTAAVFPITGTINSYNIPFSGTYNVGTSEVFTSLTNANGLFASINGTGMAGNATFNITSDLVEDGTNALNQWTESGAGNYTLTIQPDGPTQRTISGNVTGGLIRLDGADRVTINGSNGGAGSYLSFINTSTGGTTGTAFTFLNGATNNKLIYCDVKAYTNSSNGVILFGGSAMAGGNSNNLVDNCTIRATVGPNTGNIAVYAAGTPGNENAADTISNNIIFGYRDRGVDITASGATGWNISGNSFYNGDVSSTINYAAGTTLHGIRILGGSGYAVINNFIGGTIDQAGGTNAIYSSTLGDLSYQGILLTSTSALPVSQVKGNTIAGITVSSVPKSAGSIIFTGIQSNGPGINIGGSLASEGNMIGSNTVNSSIILNTATTSFAFTSLITGINYAGSGGTVTGNQVGGIDITNTGSASAASSFLGISVTNASAPTQVNNNVIGSNGADGVNNSIRVLSTSTALAASLYPIFIGPAVASPIEIKANTIQNISNFSGLSSGNFTGINNTATASGAVLTILNDTIKLINTTTNASVNPTIYTGIFATSPSTISGNIIDQVNLNATGNGTQLRGINVSGNFAYAITNNLLTNLVTSSTLTADVETDPPSAYTIAGILNSATTSGQIISGNTLSAFTSSTTSLINTAITGIGIAGAGTGNIFNNRIGVFINTATGTTNIPGISGIMLGNGSYNVYNNAVKLDNSDNTNAIKIYGINHAAAGSINYFFNTISISGDGTGTARSAAFIRTVVSDLYLRNNIFVNTRTGSGSNYAFSNIVSSPNTNWLATTADYNELFSSNGSRTAEWGAGVDQTFAQWQTASGGGNHSVSIPLTFLVSPYDLQPDSSTNCYLNNIGTPILTPVAIVTDINNRVRNTTTPDVGAYIFGYTGFKIILSSNSPVCAGDSVTLLVDAGVALSPTFTWRNPANAVVSTSDNPTVATFAGQYKVRVTDVNGCFVTDSTAVSIHQLPTARLSMPTSVCDSANINLTLAITGTGIITAILNTGDTLTGTAPTIVFPVSVNTTSSFYITELDDETCPAIPAGIPDTLTVIVSKTGEWLGNTSNWNDPVNWCSGVLPTATTNVTIPDGADIMPVIKDSAYCKNLIIFSGDSLTISATGTLLIAGNTINNGTYIDSGTTHFKGTSGQQTFTGIPTFNNLTVNNATGILLSAAIVVKNNLTIIAGKLNANNFNISLAHNWINNASVTALTAGNGTVTFNGITSQTIGGTFVTTFNNLVIADTISTTLLINTAVAGNLSVSKGIFDIATFTANRTAAGGTLTVSNNATLKIGGTNTYPVNYTVNTLVVASTVLYFGINQTIANQVYGNLTLSSSSGAAVKTFPASALSVVGNLTSTVGTGTSVAFTAAANMRVDGNVTIGASTTFNGGSYLDSVGHNWVNNGTFNGNTGSVIFFGAGSGISGSGIQSFNNLAVAGSLVSFDAGNITVGGNLATTGSGSMIQASAGFMILSGTSKTINGSGITLGNLTVSGSISTATSFNVSGNLSVTGSFTASAGTVTMTGISKSISGAGSKVFSVLSVVASVTTAVDFSISGGLFVSGSFTASAGTATFIASSLLSGTANLFNTAVNGTRLQLSANSVLGIAGALTITSGILDASTFGPNIVNFNGSGAQNINAISYSHLYLSNGNVKTATGAISTDFDINIGAGTSFNAMSYTLSIYDNWVNNGTFIAGTSTVQFLGPATAYIRGATTFNILSSVTSNSTAQLILQSNVTVDIVNMTNGAIQTGSNTLTITNTRNGSGNIYGLIQRTHAFTTGVAYAFKNANNTITFTSVSAVTSITVSVADHIVIDFPFGGAINEEYTIAVPAGTYNATLRLSYDDDKLNGNDEATMTLWNYNGSSWISSGKSGNNTTTNYVEQTGLTNISHRWTASVATNHVQWNGSVSSDWNEPLNWTVLSGAPSTPPSLSDLVDLGTIPFTNQPTISSSALAKNIYFGSSQPVVLTLTTGGSLNTSGNINGGWSVNTTHTINVNNQTLTVNGDLTLSDGIPDHSINLAIGSGTVALSGSLHQVGNSSIIFSGTGSMNIQQNFEYISGSFIAGSGTVIYNGNENQQIARVAYNNLTINKSAAIASTVSATIIAGNLLVSSGQMDLDSTTTVAGNVTINAPGVLHNRNVLHVQGNWNNNGAYDATGASIFFDGSGDQSISACTFNNFNINKPSGTATLTGNVAITGNLTVLAGSVDLKSFSCDRVTRGGTFTLNSLATYIIGGNNAPANFAFSSVADSSTVILNGTGAQQISGLNFGNIIFRNAGVKTLISPIAVNSNLTIESGSNFDAGNNTITLNGNWINNGSFTPSTSTLLCNGLLKTISGNNTFNRFTVNGSYTLLNNNTFNDLLNVTASGSLSGGSTIVTTVNGDQINSGILLALGTSTYTGNVKQTISLINAVQTVAGIVNFNGSVSPVLNSTSAPLFAYLNINNTGGVSPSVGWTVLYGMTVGAGASFNGGNATHTFQGAVTNNGTITSSGILNFTPPVPAAINFGTNFSSTGTVIFNGSGAITLSGSPTSLHDVLIANANVAGVSPVSNWTITNNFSVNTGAVFNAGSYTYTVGGNILNNGTINRGSSSFTLNGSNPQVIQTNSSSPFHNITVQNASQKVVLSADMAVYGLLNFISGTIQTGVNKLFISSTGTVAGAGQSTGWINGNLQKNVAIGTNIVRNFEVGDSVNYSPVSVVLANVTSSGDLTNKATPADHPNLASSDIDVNRSVNRYYNLRNDGTAFSNAAITFNWVPTDVDAGAITTAFRVKNYNDNLWSLLTSVSPLPTSIQATGVTTFGDFAIGQLSLAVWTGALSNDWFSSGNWSSGVPLLLTNASIPGSLANYPVLTTGVGAVQNVTIAAGAALTVNGAVLQVSGIINNGGAFTVNNGTIEMNGTVAQVIPVNAFMGNSLKNLTVNNNAGVSLEGTLLLGNILKVTSGVLKSNGYLTLVSTATATALIDGSGAGEVLGNVTMQRYLPSGLGYKYVSSPFHAATVSEFAEEVNLKSSFPLLYRYDESQSASGWLKYIDSSAVLNPGEGYSANFGTSDTVKMVAVTGVVNNNAVATAILYNHNQPFTTGFNLVGNPYPSPIDWDASSGWSRPNIDNALYFYNNSATNPYSGSYSTYINGISSGGVATGLIGSMQGFLVHVSDGSYPVSGVLSFSNSVRITNLATYFHRQMTPTAPIVRLSAGFADEGLVSDHLVVYFDKQATKKFDKNRDALKIMNTDAQVPNFYAITGDGSKLSICAWPMLPDSTQRIPLSLKIQQTGFITINAATIDNIQAGTHIYLYDSKLQVSQDLQLNPAYRVKLDAGAYDNRFFLVSANLKDSVALPVTTGANVFNVYSAGRKIYANLISVAGDRCEASVTNSLGQVLIRKQLNGNGLHDLGMAPANGLYIITIYTQQKTISKKIFVGK